MFFGTSAKGQHGQHILPLIESISFFNPLGRIVVGQQYAGRKQRSFRLIGGMAPVHICGYQRISRHRGVAKLFTSTTSLDFRFMIIEKRTQKCHQTLRISDAFLSLLKPTAIASLRFSNIGHGGRDIYVVNSYDTIAFGSGKARCWSWDGQRCVR